MFTMERQNDAFAAESCRQFSQSHDVSSHTNGATITHHHRFQDNHQHQPNNYPTTPPRTDDGVDPSPDFDITRLRELNCDRRRPEEEKEDKLRMITMSSNFVGKTVAPFLKEHVPEMYAPVSKIESAQMYQPSKQKDPNSKYCYRHQPDSKCRKAADENKMAMIQSELDKLPQDDQAAITSVWSLFSAAPAKHRELMIQGILSSSCFPQLSLVSREVQAQLKIDFISALPAEISLKILCYLDTISLCKAAQVSRQWRILADDDTVWQRMCQQHIDRKCTKCGWGLPLLERARLRNWTRRKQLTSKRQQAMLIEDVSMLTVAPTIPAPNTPKSPASPKRGASYFDDEPEQSTASSKRRCLTSVGSSDAVIEQKKWKDVYKDRFKIGLNWKLLRYSLKLFQGHTNGVTCLQLFDDGVLATGSYDNTIIIWDIETGEKIRTLTGHTGGIRALQLDDSKLVSCSLDHTVKLWDWKKGTCLRTLRSHSGGVISVHFDHNVIASGSIDKTIRVYDFETNTSFSLQGVHEDWVNHVKVDMTSRTLLSASDDCTICLWDLDTRQVIRRYHGHVGHVQQVLALPADFEPDEDPATAQDHTDTLSVSSGRSSTSMVGQTSSASPLPDDNIRHLYGPSFIDDPSRPLPARYIISAGLDAHCKLWDTATGQCIRDQWGHLEGIWSVECDSLRMVTGGNDSMVKVWDPSSGKCTGTFTGHRGPVTCVGVSDSFMASGSEDGEVRLYNFKLKDGCAQTGGSPGTLSAS